MMHKEKVAVCSEIVQNTQHTTKAMQKFWLLNWVVRKETARL